jgi:hypothetical protein
MVGETERARSLNGSCPSTEASSIRTPGVAGGVPTVRKPDGLVGERSCPAYYRIRAGESSAQDGGRRSQRARHRAAGPALPAPASEITLPAPCRGYLPRRSRDAAARAR